MDKYTVIDIETTGHSVTTGDCIIDVGIVVVEKQTIVDEYTTLLKPNKSIPTFITQLTGITDEDVADAPSFSNIAQTLIDFFKNSYLVAHNVPFDLGFLNEELQYHDLATLNNPVLDTVEMARILYPQAPSYKLGQLATYLNLAHTQPHRALSDAYITAEILIKLKTKIARLPYETVTHLLRLEKYLHSDLYILLQKQQEKMTFSIGENESFDFFNGLAFKKANPKEEKPQPITDSFGEFLDQIYERNGTMEKVINNYEYRTGQREMSEHIYDSFQGHTHALIEAETGIGKSLAYLLPAIYEAITKGERLIVSTYTTQLQSQLLEEDIPFMKKMIVQPINVALLKGKHHYLSLARFERSLFTDKTDNYDIILTQAIILIWLTETETGDIDEIHLPASGYYYYKTISTESEGTVDPNSPWFSHSYYQKARVKAQQADVVITNHALLCTDIFNDYKLLPKYQKAIIDEAHHFETTAAKHYGLKLDYVTTQYALNQIGSMNDGKNLHILIQKHPEVTNYISTEQWQVIFSETKHEIDELFRTLFQYVLKQTRQNKTMSDIGRIQYRLQGVHDDNTAWDHIIEIAKRAKFNYRDLIHMLSIMKQSLEHDAFTCEDINDHIQTLQTFIDGIEQFFLINEPYPQVKWIEIEAYGAKNAVYLYREPLDVSTLLMPYFFNEKQSVILTSATLTMRDSFSYMAKQFGLDVNQIITKKLSSPFSYRDQVQLLVPNDFPDINQQNLEPFIYATCEAIISLAHVTKGRMLVLFTSYDMLRKAHNILRESIDANDFMLIAQGITSGSRSRLKKSFQTFDQSILLGTSSFWEGIDIPGDALSSLVIVRLPFSPPDHPIYEAKSAQIHDAGKNPFFELALPHAVIRFKQGFGRLIRSTRDRGIVFICDARIVKARYGHFFTRSIPEIPLHYDSTYELIHKAEEWF